MLLDLLARTFVPVIPEQGSVGASGDLAPLAHLALVLIGEGEAMHENAVLANATVLGVIGATRSSLPPRKDSRF